MLINAHLHWWGWIFFFYLKVCYFFKNVCSCTHIHMSEMTKDRGLERVWVSLELEGSRNWDPVPCKSDEHSYAVSHLSSTAQDRSPLLSEELSHFETLPQIHLGLWFGYWMFFKAHIWNAWWSPTAVLFLGCHQTFRSGSLGIIYWGYMVCFLLIYQNGESSPLPLHVPVTQW
jgi:hypothetical protein